MPDDPNDYSGVDAEWLIDNGHALKMGPSHLEQLQQKHGTSRGTERFNAAINSALRRVRISPPNKGPRK